MSLPLSYIQSNVKNLNLHLNSLSGRKILILGGTGFLGSWITATLMTAKDLGLDCELIFVTRNSSELNRKIGINRKGPKIQIHEIDLSRISKIPVVDFDVCILGATSSTPDTGGLDSQNIIQSSISAISIVESALLNYSSDLTVLHLSSGAVHPGFGKQFIPFEETLKIGKATTPYITAKINLEVGLLKLKKQFRSLNVMNPRLFTFYGPKLPLDAHFAIGNFMKSSIERKEIVVNGNPGTKRSYLHAADLARIAIKMICAPCDNPLNIGSENEITIRDLTGKFSEFFNLEVKFSDVSSNPASYYIPSTSATKSIYGEFDLVNFEKGIRDWHQWSLELGS
jgi:dTDP-glucose 4,6-dehydratase